LNHRVHDNPPARQLLFIKLNHSGNLVPAERASSNLGAPHFKRRSPRAAARRACTSYFDYSNFTLFGDAHLLLGGGDRNLTLEHQLLREHRTGFVGECQCPPTQHLGNLNLRALLRILIFHDLVDHRHLRLWGSWWWVGHERNEGNHVAVDGHRSSLRAFLFLSCALVPKETKAVSIHGERSLASKDAGIQMLGRNRFK